jgi:S-adenosylmethionine-diacylglycerol 3-amino-3-carboxypropyl transferase
MPLKFAVVREDPELEASLVERSGARAALLVASGGCTALTLARRFPTLQLTAFDLNPRQLQHLADKAVAAARGELARLNVGDARPDGLNQSGEFEGLFRILRAGVEEFVAPRPEIAAYFDGSVDPRPWLQHRYWPALFATTFNDPLLHAMFGPDATQHAAPGSYPDYFRRAFERGLLDAAGPRNPFLQHVLLGYYRPEEAPPYVGAAEIPPIELIEGSLPEVAELDRFDLYSLSNIFDWSADALVAEWGERLQRAARPGATVLIRQLNNRRDVTRFFAGFRFDAALGDALSARDRSLFYERVLVGTKT